MNKITIIISDENDEVVAQGTTASPEIAEQLLAQLIKAGNL